MTGYRGECRFCVLPERWRVVHETANFVVQAGLGPLAEGYVLILTRTHVSCFGALEEARLPEFERLLEKVREAQRELYGSSLYFEHGRSGACLPEGHGEDLCYHAHLHLLPTELELGSMIAADHEVEVFVSWSEVVKAVQANPEPYVLAQHGGEIYLAWTPDRLPKRYLRTKLATALGRPELADWVAFPSYPLVRESLRIAQALA